MATFPIQLVIEVTEQYAPDWHLRSSAEDPPDLIELVAFVGQERHVIAKTNMDGYHATQNPHECLRELLKDVMS